jgi:hypothetical protein
MMIIKTKKTFYEVVDQFLEQDCSSGANLHVTDRALFSRFRAFWQKTSDEAAHPALLGQFRVALVERGYRASGGKRPRWHGLALRGKPKID